MSEIENRTYDEIKVGDSVSLTRTLTQQDIELFAVMSGDVNPVHVDEAFARDDMFHKIINPSLPIITVVGRPRIPRSR